MLFIVTSLGVLILNMMTNMRTIHSLLMVLVLLFGTKVFAQEWEHPIGFHLTDSMQFRQYCAYEMSDRRTIVSSALLYNDGSTHPFYPPHNALLALSPNGEELARKDYFRPGYWGSSYNPYVFENGNGEVYALMTYSPDHDTCYFNYFKNYDNPPTDAILGLYKLNENLEIIESHEHRFPIDTFEVHGNQIWEFMSCEHNGNIFLHSAILDDGYIVGAYTKIVSKTHDTIRGYDSLFFFRMNFEGELLVNKGIELTNHSGVEWQMVFWREHLVSTDDGYIYYEYLSNVPPAPDKADESGDYAGTVAYLDKELNLLRTRKLVHPGGNYYGSHGPFYFEDISITRSNHNTTYLATRTMKSHENTQDDCYLYELDDAIEGEEEIVPIVHELSRKTNDYDAVAESRAVDICDDNSFFYCYTMKIGFWDNTDGWVVIERLDNDFNTMSEAYYSNDSDNLWCCAESITTTRDKGVLLTLYTRIAHTPEFTTTVVKFPAGSFVGIEEAHANGLKVAVAYPNPGNATLNIRTALKGATVEVYDLQGRMVSRQAVDGIVTTIATEDWPSGVYLWKVLQDGNLSESGKWVKE